MPGNPSFPMRAYLSAGNPEVPNKRMSLLIHVHCSSCDWDGMGDPEDPCYRCHGDTLHEVDPEDERCFECGQRKAQCECEEP